MKVKVNRIFCSWPIFISSGFNPVIQKHVKFCYMIFTYIRTKRTHTHKPLDIFCCFFSSLCVQKCGNIYKEHTHVIVFTIIIDSMQVIHTDLVRNAFITEIFHYKHLWSRILNFFLSHFLLLSFRLILSQKKIFALITYDEQIKRVFQNSFEQKNADDQNHEHTQSFRKKLKLQIDYHNFFWNTREWIMFITKPQMSGKAVNVIKGKTQNQKRKKNFCVVCESK